MTTRPWDEPKNLGPLGGAVRDEILAELCDRRTSFILATPYLNFESRFVERIGNRLKVRATMSKETVKHALEQQSLRMRFPWALSFYCGSTTVLDYEIDGNKRHLILSLPETLILDEQRHAQRLDRLGNSSGALGSQEASLVRVNLDNLSTLGVAVFAIEPIPANGFQIGRSVDISLSLEGGTKIQAMGRIRHQEVQTLGLDFYPPLETQPLQRLIEWLKPRHEDARKHWDNRALFRAQAEQAAQPKAPPSGILVVTKDQDVVEKVSLLLEDIPPVRAVLPALAPLKQAMETPPFLLILHLSGEGGEERHRIRTLLESISPQYPRLILGNGQNAEQGRQLAMDVRAGLYWDWDPSKAVFFQRLVKGMIRKHWGESSPESIGKKNGTQHSVS